MEEAARAANASKAREEREGANRPGVISSALDALGDIFGSDNDLKEQGKNANKKAIKHLEINDKGYFKGHHKWVDGDGYNNVNYYIGDDGNYYSVKRLIDTKSGLITIVGDPTRLTKETYNKKINQKNIVRDKRGNPKTDTWCNYGENAFSQPSGAPLLTIHPVTGNELNVNRIYDALEDGVYDSDVGSYVKISDYKEAEKLASSGYHVIVIKQNVGKSGHIAKLMGGFVSEEKTQGNLKVWQAGTRLDPNRRSGYKNLFGIMSLYDGFRRKKGQKFWIWKPRRK